MTGCVDEQDKPAIYRLASVFIYPSHYEGWGMQPVEAMACGVPVIASDKSSLQEVVGKAAKIVNPDIPVDITKALTQVLTSSKERTKMVRAGLAQAKKFSWEKSASRLVKLLRGL